MKNIPALALVAAVTVIGLFGLRQRGWSASDPSSAPLRLVADVAVPGPAGRFDYESLDTVSGRLYISQMGAGRLLVFDTRAGRVVSSLPGFPRATGVLAVPEQRRVYVSVAGRHELAVLDDSSFATVGRIGGIRFPDGIAYAPDVQQIFVSDEAGGADIAIDARRYVRDATIELGGEAGNTHYDPVVRRILGAVQTRNELVAIDPVARRITARYPVPCSHPHGFLIDPPQRLAFVSCEADARLLVIDLRTMRTIATHTVGHDPDVLAFDPTLKRLYVASESGTVSVFEERGKELMSLGSVHIPHAHSIAVDQRTHRVYLPLENVGGRPVLRIMEPMSQ